MTGTPQDQILQNGTTIPLSSVNPPAPQEKKESFFDKQLNRVVGFLAKATGQPDPKTGSISSNTTPITATQATTITSQLPNGETVNWISQETLPSVNIPTPPMEEEQGFFQKLVANTQNLLSKTGDFATSIANKTSAVAGTISNSTQNFANGVVEKTNAVSSTITSAPTMIANQAGNLIDKGVAMWGQLKDNIQTNAQNLTSNPLSGIQNLGGQLTEGVQQIGGQMGSGIQNLGQQTLQQGQNLVSNPLGTVENLGTQVATQGQQLVNNPIWTVGNLGNQVVQQGQALASDPLRGVQNLWNQVNTQVGNLTTPPPQTLETVPTLPNEEATSGDFAPHTSPILSPVSNNPTNNGIVNSGGLLSSLGQGAQNFFEKTKEIWTTTFDKTKDFIQNPVEHIDSLAGAGAEQTPLPPQTPNTNSLENLIPAETPVQPQS